ncbi:MAG: hypothetical protein HZB67_02190 [Candidatus Aenigmarchaeota archaeon]|nr:hypothetical protein [Candidatus Aenigmarchaeota archaeon]
MHGRKRGHDPNKIAAIVAVLARNPDGIWIRKIAEETKMHPSTVSKYVDTVLHPIVEATVLGGDKPIMKVVRLQPIALAKLQEGQNIAQIIRYLSLINKA